MYTNNFFDFDNDDSISNVAAHHEQTFDPEAINVAEFRTDDDQWTYLVMEVSRRSYVLL